MKVERIAQEGVEHAPRVWRLTSALFFVVAIIGKPQGGNHCRNDPISDHFVREGTPEFIEVSRRHIWEAFEQRSFDASRDETFEPRTLAGWKTIRCKDRRRKDRKRCFSDDAVYLCIVANINTVGEKRRQCSSPRMLSHLTTQPYRRLSPPTILSGKLLDLKDNIFFRRLFGG